MGTKQIDFKKEISGVNELEEFIKDYIVGT